MATLNSPGVAVTVVDESFYTPSAPGTTPLIIVASEQDKENSAGTGTAPGTQKANAGKVYLLTSQLDLGATFGTPYFQTDASNNPVHAGELNEYGLQAAYSYLGVSSRAYVVRADIDTKQLIGTANIPAGSPTTGTYWFDTTDTSYGVFEWNANPATTTGGQTFTNKVPTVITDATKLDGFGAPLTSIGAIGSYALVATTTLNKLYFKNYTGVWVQVGSNAWTSSWPTVQGTTSTPTITTGLSMTIAASPTPTISVTPTATTAQTTVTVTATAITNNLITATNTFAGGEIISFSSSFNGVVAATRYYVLSANLTGSSFAISSSPGGTAQVITTTGSVSSTGTVTSATVGVITAANAGTKLVVGDPIVFGGTAFGGIVAGTTYYVIAAAGNTFSISTTITGIPFVLTTASGASMTALESETTYTVTGVTTLAGVVSAIGTRIAGVTAVANSNNQLALYCDGTVTNLTLSGTMLTALGITANTYYCPSLSIAPHTQVPAFKALDSTPRTTGSVWIKSTYPNLGASWSVWVYNANTATFGLVNAPLYASSAAALAALDPTGGGVNLPVGTLYVKFNDGEYNTATSPSTPQLVDFKIHRRAASGPTTITSAIIKTSTFTSGTNTFTAIESLVGTAFLGDYTGAGSQGAGKTVTFTATGVANDANVLAGAINAAGFTNVVASVNSSNQLVIQHSTGGTIRFADGTNTPLTKIFVPGTTTNMYSVPAAELTYTFGQATNWKTLQTSSTDGITYVPSASAPTTLTADGTLWYNSATTDVDILVNDGTHWRGLNNYNFTTRTSATLNYGQTAVTPFASANATDPNGPIISATAPTAQSTGSALVNGDIWVSTADLENFPHFYVWNISSLSWILKDNSDQTTESGVVFADARWNSNGLTNNQDTIITMMNSDFVDFDAPDPALYPKGTLLWNTRRSSFNVKKFQQNYVNVLAKNYRSWTAGGESMTLYYPHRWVSQAANQADGSGTFGRKAQRAVVVQALQAMVNSNQAIRDEDSLTYNLIACPGYTELIDEMVALNYDRGLQSFVVADTPARLTPDATSLTAYGNNAAKAVTNGEQAVLTVDPYLGVYYPWGFSSDNLGNNVAVPPSHMMLRTIALSDNVSYPWFAPAGTRRGGITNATAVGYVDKNGEFQSVALNSGQRDALASIHINPITFIAGTGLVAYGQYTRQLAASSLDRINVARLVVYLRRQFTQLAKPYVFEPNDTITRNEIKQHAESLLLELVGQRALYDYLVVCDTSNNTPARIDRSELYLDVAIEPVKAAEFIYIPLRLENTGAIKGLGK